MNKQIKDLQPLSAAKANDEIAVQRPQSIEANRVTLEVLAEFLQDLLSLEVIQAQAAFKGVVSPTDSPAAGVYDGFWITTKSGTYANFGGVVVNVNSLAVISRVSGVYSVNQAAFSFDLSNYATSTQLNAAVKGVTDLLPKKIVKKTTPTANVGFYAYNTGAFTAGASGFKGVLLTLADYTGDILLTASYSNTAIALVVYFDSSMGYLGYEFRGTGVNQNVDKLKITPIANTAFIGVTFQSTNLLIFTREAATDALSKSVADNLYPSITDFRNARNVLPQSKTDITGAITPSSYYSTGTGNLQTNNALFKTTIIDLSVHTGAIFVTAVLNNSGTALAVYFNEFGERISEQFQGPVSGSVVYSDQLLTIPIGAKTAGITGLTTNPLIIKEGSVATDVLTKSLADGLYSPPKQIIKQVKLSLAPANKILLYGTSISSSIYPWYATSMQTLTGVTTVTKGGFSGYTASLLAKNTQIQSIFDAQANLIINEIGANDSGDTGTVGTFSGGIAGEPIVAPTDISADYNGSYFIQAIDHHMRKLKAYYYNIRARANLTGSETEAEKTTKIDAVLKPYIVYLSGIPQNRTDANSVFSKPENWARKEAAIIEAGNKNGMHVILFGSICGFDMSLEPYFTGGSQGTTNNLGVKTMDGVHLNKYGYDELARAICGGLGIV